jgi:PAS domain S-box-containing protein
VTAALVPDRAGGDATRQIAFQARLLDAVEQAVIATDLTGAITYWNRFAERLYGWTAQEVMGRNIVEVTPAQESAQQATEIMERLRQGESWAGEFMVRRKNGDWFSAHVTDSPVHDEHGQLVGIVGISSDISAQKEAERHKSLLLDELNHRVKNTLAVVSAIAGQIFRSKAGHPEQFMPAFVGALQSLGHAHDLLTQDSWRGASLRDIVTGALQPYCGTATERVEILGEDVSLEPNKAVAMALAVHELATNAAKYGALSNDRGRIQIRWSVKAQPNEKPVVAFDWLERDGPPVKPPLKKGFGTQLIERGLAAQLDGQVSTSYEPAGFRLSVRFTN